ncbi:uncharacterized protein OCT59_004932 [Rhizophagus irregularis]|uniref:Uncharacterized protein n=1 Tax=Rhizophagus irregularis (strain DAOM 197198w) TaxID=1432141 RepID=A0A015KUG4_RHIIW|nr:hypothetical protein RirG_151000 [Rhizophagus irregularis DAOM 197198w]UZO13433.1 hypothetical protein OCT59_004932 [Rhizophagus irregularis]GBC21645.1 hypothetical protein GLOIN_2v1475955 [Rhizophagus irregularis DAOM 181602=DAOM 197198]
MKVAKKYQQQVADAVKEGKKRSLAKQGDGVEEEEEKDSESDGWTVSINKKRGGKPGSYGRHQELYFL